eukprot:962655_1
MSDTTGVGLGRLVPQKARNWIVGFLEKSTLATGIFLLVLATPAYFCVYAIRTATLVPGYEGEKVFGIPLKDAFGIAQVLGYTLGKLPSLKYCTRLTRDQWGKTLVALMICGNLCLFGLVVPNHKIRTMTVVMACFCISPTWGVFLRYLEGRRMSDLMFAAFNFSFIAGSGVWRSVTTALHDSNVPIWWTPLLVGTVATCAFIPMVILLDLAPKPTTEEKAARSHRKPATLRNQLDMFRRWWPGLTALIVLYSVFSTLRNFYDFFNPEIWKSFSEGEVPAIYTTLTDVPSAALISISLHSGHHHSI